MEVAGKSAIWTSKYRIWTSHRVRGSRHCDGEDLWPVLPDRARRGDLRRAMDAADHPKPASRLRDLRGDPRGRARPLSHLAHTAARAARTNGHRRVRAEAPGTWSPLPTHRLGP